MDAAVDEAAVRSIVDEAVGPAVEAAVQRVGVKRIEIKIPDRPAFDATGQHERFPLLLSCLAARESVWLVGPAGSGKSYAARAAAEALGLPFESFPVGPDSTAYEVTGHRSVTTGEYMPTAFRRRYEQGGVLLIDEADAGADGALLPVNDSLSNGHAAFPDGQVARHADFCCVAAANTYGLGANRVYVGRSQQDATFLDRFVFLEWGYDEALERRLAGDQTDWCSYVQACRHAADRLGVRHVISPRATVKGANLLRAGVSRSDVEAMVLWKGLPADQRAKIESGVK